jgi:hypothetical protein
MFPTQQEWLQLKFRIVGDPDIQDLDLVKLASLALLRAMRNATAADAGAKQPARATPRARSTPRAAGIRYEKRARLFAFF